MNLSNDDVKNKVVEMYNQGMSIRGISDITGIGRSTIGDFLRGESHKEWWANQLDISPKRTKEGPKILFADIETSPLLLAGFGLFNQNFSIDQIITDWEIMVACAKWLGDDEIITLESSEYWMYNDKQALENVVTALWCLLDEADIIVCHNVKFDNKKIKAKFREYNLPPPSPYKTVCTLNIAKQEFGFTSNKLDYLSRKLHEERKEDTGGIRLWLDCMEGIDEAWDNMISYCQKDVALLEGLYLGLRQWDSYAPNVQPYYNDDKERCGHCGSENVEEMENKQWHTNVSSFDLVRCNDCGAIRRGRKNTRNKNQMKATTMNVR